MNPIASIERRTVHVDGCEVGLDIQLLQDGERQRVAASIAWLVLARADDADPDVWERFVSDIIAPHVAFTIDESLIPAHGELWWTHLVRTAATEFIDVNRLDPLIRRHADADTRTI